MSRKYRHSGYQDEDRDRGGDDRDRGRSDGGTARPRKELSFEEKIQRKSMRHAIDRETQEVLRCFVCGQHVDEHGAIGFEATCAKCEAALHCCRNCRHFSSSARWQCTAPIETPVGDRTKNNECREFRARLALDHTGRRTRASSGNGRKSRPASPRDAFDNLFKR